MRILDSFKRPAPTLKDRVLRRTPERPRRSFLIAGATAAVGAAGAAIAYLFDPRNGRRRRAMLRDRSRGAMHGAVRRGERTARRVGSAAYGVKQKMTHLRPEPKQYDDLTLVHKVESEALRSLGDGARLNIEAADGVVTLRGTVDDLAIIRRIERSVRRTRGVRGVKNLLHLPGTPAPNKEQALRAGGNGA